MVHFTTYDTNLTHRQHLQHEAHWPHVCTSGVQMSDGHLPTGLGPHGVHLSRPSSWRLSCLYLLHSFFSPLDCELLKGTAYSFLFISHSPCLPHWPAHWMGGNSVLDRHSRAAEASCGPCSPAAGPAVRYTSTNCWNGDRPHRDVKTEGRPWCEILLSMFTTRKRWSEMEKGKFCSQGGNFTSHTVHGEGLTGPAGQMWRE